MIFRRLSIAALLSIAFAAPSAAQNLGIGDYRLGMSLEDFRAQAIPGATARPALRILCSYEREMQDHMVGVLHYQFDTSAKAGALVCIFAQPDHVSGARSGWWEEAAAPFADHGVKWRFWFTQARNQPGRWELFALAGHGTEKIAENPTAVAAIKAQLVQEIGAGADFADERYKGLVWNKDGQQATFLIHQGEGVLDDSSVCFGIAHVPTVTAINQRLAPSSMRLAGLCRPNPS